ncbi:MEST-like protein [Mya arenaria]|uniref:MEST-like protein n=1 Tax=Mya arenaria TaxID=6604 RepID=A0ABY7FX28_MYAAR|nr:MEST-like protein [Mya arenaria]
MKSQFSKIIMLDMLGYGFSDKPLEHDYLITEQADIHEALLTSLSIPRAHVMSHDYGDTVALELLHRKVVPSPSITVLDAAIGHYPQWEDPNAVFESYKSFLQSIKKT